MAPRDRPEPPAASAPSLVESVPNFSEGRRRAVIDAILAAVRRSGPVRCLDFSSDPDHNRSVLTLAGHPDAVRAALEALVLACVERLDLRAHQGGHPRMGAVDVIPLVPIRGVTMEDCVRMARDLGAAIAARHGLPVYLYEKAASAPHRRNLAEIRKGEFEGFPDKIKDPLWKPDFGPDRVHPTAGCVAVGARARIVRAEQDIVEDREEGKEPAPLEDVRDAFGDGAVGRQAVDPLIEEGDPPRRRPQEPRDRVHQRGLAGAVRAEQAHDLALVHPHRSLPQDLEIAVGDVEPLDGQHAGALTARTPARGRPRRPGARARRRPAGHRRSPRRGRAPRCAARPR